MRTSRLLLLAAMAILVSGLVASCSHFRGRDELSPRIEQADWTRARMVSIRTDGKTLEPLEVTLLYGVPAKIIFRNDSETPILYTAPEFAETVESWKLVDSYARETLLPRPDEFIVPARSLLTWYFIPLQKGQWEYYLTPQSDGESTLQGQFEVE